MSNGETVSQQILTCGDYGTEEEGWADFDRLIELHPDVFKVAREVSGWYVSQRMNTQAKTPRIDRILFPRKRLVEAGWTHGPIGVEGKTSKKKAGPAISQAMDYSRAVFQSPFGCHSRIMLEWVFVWPIREVKGAIASIMMQNRIGHVFARDDGTLVFKADQTTAIKLLPSGAIYATELPMGRKVGSR